MTDSISEPARARREAARESGRFGTQPQSAPETTLPKPTAREQRLAKLHERFDAVKVEWEASQAALLAEYVSAAWETVPLSVERIQFHNYGGDEGGLFYRGMFDADGHWVHEEGVDYRDIAEWADLDDLTHGLEHDGGYVALRVGKDATRERIAALQSAPFTRPGNEISAEIDIAVTRYMGQVAAEKGFQSVTLSWDQEGRAGLRATHVTAADGHCYKAGSGALDDHEIIWAAAYLDTPTPRMTTTDGAAPFTLTFGS